MSDKMEMDAAMLRAFLEVARRNDTVSQWADIAMQWIEAAEAEIVRLRAAMKGESR